MTRKTLGPLVFFLFAVGALVASHLTVGPAEAAPRASLGPRTTASAPVPPAVITDITLKTSDGSMIGLEILGSGFGTASPTKRLYIDGIQADMAEVYPWTDTKISVDEEVFFEITKNFIWVDHTYTWEIRDGTTPISNVFSKAFLLEIHSVRPKSGPVGSTIELTGAGFGHPGDLMMGRTPCEILSRTAGRIQARVPFVKQASQVIGIRQGNRLISNTLPFTVGPAKVIRKD